MSEIAKAYVQIVPTTEGIGSALQSALGDPVEKQGDASGKSFGSSLLKTAGATIAAGAAALGAAVGATVKSVVNATTEMAALGDEIDKNSQKLGVSASFYQEWDAVLQHSGTSMDSMTATFKRLATSSQDATDEQIAAYEALGLTIDEVSKMSAEDLFTSVISGLQEMDEGTERTALATELLGKNALELGALLNTSAEDTQAMIDTVNDLGGVMSDDAVKASAKFQDTLQDMKTAFSGVKYSLIGDFLPSITMVMDGIKGLVSGDSGALSTLSEGIKGFLNSMSSMVPQITEIAKTILPTIVSAIIENLPMLIDSAIEIIDALVDGLLDNLPLLIDGAVQIITSLCTGFIELLPSLVDAGFQLIIGLAEGLIEALPDLLESAMDLIVSMTEKMTEPDSLNQLIKTAIALVGALIKGITNSIPKLIQAAANIITNISKPLTDNLNKLKEKGKEILLAIVSGILGKITEITKAASNIISKLVSGLKSGLSQIRTIGTNLIIGLWNGIGDKVEWIKSKIKGFGSSVISAIKGIFGIHSPSKVFAEIGGFLAKGLGVGWDDEIEDVQHDIEDSLVFDIGNLSGNASITATAGNSLGDRLSKIEALLTEYLEDGRAIYLDGDTIVGGTARRMNTALGKLAAMSARG